MRTVCVEAERKNAKLKNWTLLEGLLTIREHQNFLEEGTLTVEASVACVVSYHYHYLCMNINRSHIESRLKDIGHFMVQKEGLHF